MHLDTDAYPQPNNSVGLGLGLPEGQVELPPGVQGEYGGKVSNQDLAWMETGAVLIGNGELDWPTPSGKKMKIIDNDLLIVIFLYCTM